MSGISASDVQEIPNLKHTWEFILDVVNFRLFKKIFLTAFQGHKKPLSHHEDVIGAEIEKPADRNQRA